MVAIWDDQGHIVATQTVYVARRLVPEAVTLRSFYDLGGPAVTYTLTVPAPWRIERRE